MQRLTIVLTSLVLTSASLTAQGPQQKGAAPPPAESGQSAQPPLNTQPSADTVRIDAYVRYSDGRAVEFARVTVSDSGRSAKPRRSSTRTDSTGRFVIDSVALGTYDLQVFQVGSVKPHERRLVVDGRPIQDVLIPSRPWWQRMWRASWLVTFIVLFVYIFTVFATRWHHIARSLTAIIESEFAGLRMRIHTEVTADDDKREALEGEINSQLEKVRERQKERWFSKGHGLGDVLWWSRGVENAAWAAIHEMERQLVAFLAPPARVDVHLIEVQARLREVKTQPAFAIADGIRDSLAVTTPRDANLDQQRRALLARSLQILNNDRDNTFSALMEWQNKASWLMLAAAIIILFLAGSVGNAVLFLAGAAGGFLSRLARALKSDDIPLDYGASWTTLFLSPLFGALVGWFGIALIAFLTQPNVNLLGDAFRAVEWTAPTHPITLSIAFLLGFSERFFDAIVGVVEKQVGRSDMSARTDDAVRSTTVTTSVETPTTATDAPSSAGGITIDLPDTPFTPVQTVSGKIVLDKATTAATAVTLTSDNADYSVNPASLTIAAGATDGPFDVIPKGNAAPGTIRITAQSGSTTVSDTIKYT